MTDYLIPLGTVGPANLADGQQGWPMRTDRTGALVTHVANGSKYEHNARGKLYHVCAGSASGALTGVTVIAEMVSPPAATKKTVLSLYNPGGSGVDVVVLKSWLSDVSGTPGVGAWSWCVSLLNGVAMTATENCTPIAVRTGGRGLAKGFSNTALTAGLVHALVRPFGHAPFGGAIAAAGQDISSIDNTDGDIVCPPGGIISICPPATGTTHIVVAGITYAEIPIQSGA